MAGKLSKKVLRKLKRPEEEWYFNATHEMLRHFRFLLDLPSINCTAEFWQSEHFLGLLHGDYREFRGKDTISIDRKLVWQKFRSEIEEKIGCIGNDSCSTLATIDDNPGAGRLIDKFIYQPVGRSIERLFLNLELRYFHPPEKSARQIKRFLGDFGDYHLIQVDEMDLRDFQSCLFYAARYFHETLVSFLLDISREEKVVKAFQRLLIQASSKQRSIRIEAQKRLWSLLSHNNMIFILNIITDLRGLMWDGHATFQHCSPLDPDYRTQFYVRWGLELYTDNNNTLVDMRFAYLPRVLENISIRDILETCARENRGFTSLPINRVLELFKGELYLNKDKKLEYAEEYAENLNLALAAFIGFRDEFPYSSTILELQVYKLYARNEPNFLLPLWGEERNESKKKALELMIQFLISLIIFDLNKGPMREIRFDVELSYYIALLNDVDKDQRAMGELEARASEDYLRKVSMALVLRGPISFAMFKDIVTNPIIWEKYFRPERQSESTDEARMVSTWDYKLHISYVPRNPLIPLYDYAPFSDSFRQKDFDMLRDYVRHGLTPTDFVGPRASWFQIQRWLKELKSNSMALPGDRPGTYLHPVMEWWRFYFVTFLSKRLPTVKEFGPPTSSARLLAGSEGELATLSPLCQCILCIWSLHIPEEDEDGTLPRIEEHSLSSQTEDILSQHHSSPATASSPLQGQPRILKRKLEEAEPRPQIAPLPRRYRNNTDEDVEPATLGPVWKRQKTSLNLESDASGAGSIITETDEKSTESDTGSEDAMSVDEDFLTANSKLSHLTIGN